MIEKLNKTFSRFITKKTAPYIFLGPIIVIFILFFIYPIISSFIMSFQKFESGSFNYVGLNNYKKLLGDSVFLKALKNTMIYFVFQVPIMIGLSLLIAYIINQAFIKYKTFFRISIFIPSITALVAYSLVFMLLLNTEKGMVNYILSFFNMEPIDWLNHPVMAKVSIILAVTWRWTGYNMIIMLAGLQSIPKELYEAAEIDGANTVTKFLNITVPLMKNIILFCFITSTIGTLQLFDESYILTEGGPNNNTITIVHYLYNTGFRYIKFGYAAAISYILVFLIGILSFVQFRFGER